MLNIDKRIQNKARKRSVDIINNDIQHKTLLQNNEAITQRAQQEAIQFYSTGNILLLPVSLLSKQEHVQNLYTRFFVDMYLSIKNHYYMRHPEEQGT